MPELRLTLLVLGLIFLAGLAWWELRRPHQVRGSDLPRPGPEPVERTSERSPEWTAERSADWDLPPLDLPRMSARDPEEQLPVVEVAPAEFAQLEAHAEGNQASTPAPVHAQSSVPPVKPTAGDAAKAAPEIDGVEGLLDELGADASDPPIFDMTGVFNESLGRSIDPPMSAPEAAPVPPRTPAPAPSHQPQLALEMAPPAAPEVAIAVEPQTVVAEDPIEVPVSAPVTEAPIEPELASAIEPVIASAAAPVVEAEPAKPPEPEPVSVAPAQALPPPAATPVAPETSPPAVIVEWPAPDVSQIIAIRLVSRAEKFSGRAVRMALAAEGFVLGPLDIFHKPAANGRALLSVASLAKPGTFSAESIDIQRYGGLNVFTVLPGPVPGPEAVEELLGCAQVLCQRLRGTLQDDQGESLSPARTAAMRTAAAAAPA